MRRNRWLLLVTIGIVTSQTSCKKSAPLIDYGSAKYTTVHLQDSLVFVLGDELKLNIQFVSLDSSLIGYDETQGDVSFGDLSITPPVNVDYHFLIDNFQLGETPQPENHSTLILFDKSVDGYSYGVDFDACISYWIKKLSPENEVAFGGFSDAFGSDGFKVYGDGFINGSSDDKFSGIYEAQIDKTQGNPNPISGASGGLSYLLENGINENRNIILFAFKSTDESQEDIQDLIQEANDNDVRIHVFGPHDYDYTEISVQTGGFYNHYNTRAPRLLGFSLDKILTGQYYTASVDLKVTSLTSNFPATGYFGYFLNVTHLPTAIDSRLYYHVFY